ncbi:hypothetical protein LFYK43_23510 [Ligilactobacillus salitolerans]|uniref:Uncharacterized protein n=1 Tax=Ligilactobacillus salitolerans TaxID=1808352 RepID=A0A401IWK0_9LACO|nr:hypothetical protein [Ligilactobacillus salitolerans]GBG95892.1 hypothetical protein LFYK43_23510 [Ligilactobacillus salitolerans]
MIESIRLKRKMSDEIEIGDVVQYHGGTFVVINILGIEAKPTQDNDRSVFYYCLGQLYGSPDLAADYLPTENELQFSVEQYRNVPQVGDVFFDSTLGIWIRISQICNVHFENTTMFARFKFVPIKEWSTQQMESAVAESRTRHMRLLKNN